MPFASDSVYDASLAWVSANASTIHLCSAEPTNYTELLALSLGTKSSLSFSAPQDSPSGRSISLLSLTGGSITTSGVATHWALSDGVGELIASGPLETQQIVDAGNSWNSQEAVLVTVGDAE